MSADSVSVQCITKRIISEYIIHTTESKLSMFFQKSIAHAIDFEPASVRRASFVPFIGARRLRISVSLHVYHAELNATVSRCMQITLVCDRGPNIHAQAHSGTKGYIDTVVDIS